MTVKDSVQIMSPVMLPLSRFTDRRLSLTKKLDRGGFVVETLVYIRYLVQTRRHTFSQYFQISMNIQWLLKVHPRFFLAMITNIA